MFTFIYSVQADKTQQKEIAVNAKNEGEAYALFIQGLFIPATLVVCKETKRRII